MKRTSSEASAVREMRAEYRLDYAESSPNRFVARDVRQRATLVVLDPDVAEVFSTSESVNGFLRSAISAMPYPAKRKRRPNKTLQPTACAKRKRRS